MYYKSSSDRYIKHLRRTGIVVGEGTICRPKTTSIDTTRPSLVTIGKNCSLNENFTLLTHDWVSGVFIRANMELLPSSGRVTIGNNVRFGQHCMVLKNVTIGDNCFIGANSMVTKDIPAGSIAAGSPCKVICTLEEYHEKRKSRCIAEAFSYAQSIQDRYGRRPVITDFWEEFPLFVDGDKIDDYPELKEVIKRQCGPMYEHYVLNHKANFSDFNAFLEAAGIK